MGENDITTGPSWLKVGGGPGLVQEQTVSVSSYLATRLGASHRLPPEPIEEIPAALRPDEGTDEPEDLGPPAHCFGLERDGAGSAVRAALGAARSDPGLAVHLHRPLPLGRRPTILLDLAVNLVTATERAAAGSHVSMAAALNEAVDALGTADAYAEASAVRQHRRRWLAGGLLVAAAAAGVADARWLELGFLAEAAPRLAPCARAWQVARMPSRADALIDVALSLPARLDRLTADAPSRIAADDVAAHAKRALRASLSAAGGNRSRSAGLAGGTSPERRTLLTALGDPPAP